ncbi:MAG: hypothetical protein PVF17_02315 [Ignavibacteria bacterium]
MQTYIKFILLFLTITSLVISCIEDSPLYVTSTPIAHAGDDQLVGFLDTVYLNGISSTKSESLEYVWSFNYKPSTSKAVLSDSSSPDPTFVADVAGFYSLQLVIKDKEKYSKPDFVTVQTIFTELSEEYFPQKVGNKWKYKVMDTTGITADTITVEVVGTTILPNGETASIWVYNGFGADWYVGSIDTLYLAVRADTLIYYRIRQNHLYPFLGYIVPFKVGDRWEYMWNVPTVTVLEYNSITIDIGIFSSAYQIEYSSLWLSGYRSFIWFVPHVGMVKMELIRCYPSPAQEDICYKEYWELIWYDLVK